MSIGHRCQRHCLCTLSEYLRDFSKKFETALTVYSGAWGKLINEKNQKSKISWHCPFNLDIIHGRWSVTFSKLFYRKAWHFAFFIRSQAQNFPGLLIKNLVRVVKCLHRMLQNKTFHVLKLTPRGIERWGVRTAPQLFFLFANTVAKW